MQRNNCLCSRWNELQLHQLARGVVHEHQQGAGLGTILKPALLRAVDLDQFAMGLASKPRLVEGLALLA